MKYLLIGFVGFLLFLFIIVLYFIGTYNSMVSLKTNVQTERAQIETQLQRRFDLVPALVSSVKGIMKQEKEVFGAIAEARTRYSGAQNGSVDKIKAANEYEGALARLLVVMENYPQLKTSERVADLMISLEGTENRIGVARQRYNESVREYNRSIKSFPNVLFAGVFGFVEEPMFEAVDSANRSVKFEL